MDTTDLQRDIITYTLVMANGLNAVRDLLCTRHRDSLGLCGVIGYRLHNHPAVIRALWDQDTRALAWDDGNSPGAFKGIVAAEYRAIYTRIFRISEKSVRQFAVLDPAPPDKRRSYYQSLSQLCQALRLPWLNIAFEVLNGENLDRALVSEQEVAYAEFCHYMVTAFASVPVALLRWSDFDEHKFQEDLRAVRSTLPATALEWWEEYVNLS